MGEESLKDSFSKELIKESQDPVTDITEIGIDSIFDNKIIDEVPVLKSIAAVCKIGLNIRDRYFAKKLITFIDEFRKGQLDEDKYNKFKEDMKDEKYKNRITETLIIKIDNLDDINKIFILSKLFNSFINKKISWEEFLEFSNAANYLVKEDYETLRLLNQDVAKPINFSAHGENLKGSAYKLVQYSLATYRINVMPLGSVSNVTIFHKVTERGIKFNNSLND